MAEPSKRWDFTKVEGLGNDFVVLGTPEREAWTLETRTAQALCDRRRGIGADGVLLLSASTRGDVRMEVINCDGSRPEMCGNGLRCVVALLGEPGARVEVETQAGLRVGEVRRDGAIRTDMGELVLTHPSIELPEHGPGAGWSAGNPHLLVFPQSDPDEAADKYGESWSRHPSFPEGVNVGFWREENELWRGVVHERGAGRTLACGTGAAAAAAEILRRRGASEARLELRLPGGALQAEVSAEGDRARVFLSGPARIAFEGRWFQRV
ncbi:MAG: diaminopimelate epimerase [Myxococcota bacterium]